MIKSQKGALSTKSDVLPFPIREHVFGDIHISIFKVKDREDIDFSDFSLLKMLHKARGSYARYGQVPLVDDFDTKASVYLTRTIYPFSADSGSSILLEEWSSVRFIPASGKPFSTEDLECSVYQGMSMSIKIQELLFNNHPEALDKVVTLSRVCRITPQVFGPNTLIPHTHKVPEKNMHTGLSVFLMSKIFLEESASKGKTYEWITALSKPDFFEKVLCFPWKGKEMRFPFLNAEHVMAPDSQEKIHIDRSLLSYKYPGYFLDLKDLFSFFSEMLISGRMHHDTLKKFAEFPTLSISHLQDHEDLDQKDRLKILEAFSKILLSEGWIDHGKIHADEIRKLCHEKVKDAIQLYFSSISEWKKHFYDIETSLF